MAPTFMAGNKAGRLFIGGQDVKKAYTAGELIFSKDDGPTPPDPPFPPGTPTYELLIDDSIGEDHLYYTNGLEVPLQSGYDPVGGGPGYLCPPASGITYYSAFIAPWIGGEISAIYHQIEAEKISGAAYDGDRIQARITGGNFDSDLRKPDLGTDTPGSNPVYATTHQGIGPENPDPLSWSSGSAGGDALMLGTSSVALTSQSIWLGGEQKASGEVTEFGMWGNSLNISVNFIGDSAGDPSIWPRLYSHKIWVIPKP